jgi:hypothetical protein
MYPEPQPIKWWPCALVVPVVALVLVVVGIISARSDPDRPAKLCVRDHRQADLVRVRCEHLGDVEWMACRERINSHDWNWVQAEIRATFCSGGKP